ncbi:MAG: response regulator, partial [Cyanobacteria bacterium J06639_1]
KQQLAAIEAAVDGIAILKGNTYQYVNRAHLDMFGYGQQDDLKGRDWRSLYSSEELARFDREVFPVLQRDRTWQGEAIATRKDGSTFVEGLSLTLTEDGLLICVCRDISDRKQVEQLVRQQAEREALLRQITQLVRQSLDLNATFVTAAQEIRRFLQAERVGIFQFDPSSNCERGEFVAEASVPGLPSVLAAKVRDRHFSVGYAELYRQGRIQAIDDVETSGLQDCHRTLLAQFQVRANLILPLLEGQQLWGLLCIHQCSAPRQWQPSDIDFTREIASQLEIAIQQASLYDRLQRELNKRQLAQFQLTERNQQLAISNEELARATRLKDEFLANMSHELRTPLNAILGMTEGLQEEVFGNVNARQIKALGTIERSGSHLLELINDILDIAKIEAGQLELDCTPTSIALLCNSSLSFIKQQAHKKRIHLQVNCPAPLPDVTIDERRMRQVLINLLNNAVKFTPENGRIDLNVTVRPPEPVRDTQASGQSYLRISVADTGIGIAPDQIGRLFQPFVQVDSALNRRYQGTGLGLALVKRIVELHGGRAGVTSEFGRGSCFTIDLPCDASLEMPVEPEAIATGAQPIAPVPQDASPLILMAEDNEANINTISSYLKAKGYRLIFAKNGNEAVQLARSETPDLILMDIQMPDMDGFEAMQHIRREPHLADVPIVALTALAMSGDRDRCLDAGANDYLSKPIRLKQLVTTIQKLLDPREQ